MLGILFKEINQTFTKVKKNRLARNSKQFSLRNKKLINPVTFSFFSLLLCPSILLRGLEVIKI